jgi:lipopolysaccharide/colanic/teichoic acid biosynthesis glycosyltransferase
MALQDDNLIARHRWAFDNIAPRLQLHQSAKRAFDVVVATIGLVLFAPVLLIICIAIKLESDGPIFVRYARYGYGDRQFHILRFRSAIGYTEANGADCCIGRILRQTGIDELLQLTNVLRGEMSIVGPRPYARRREVFEHECIPLLHTVKPGMTGWGSEGHETAEQRVNNDLYYAQNWSLWLDMKIALASLFSGKYRSASHEKKMQAHGWHTGRLGRPNQ